MIFEALQKLSGSNERPVHKLETFSMKDTAFGDECVEVKKGGEKKEKKKKINLQEICN